jgi:hypothetical protein|tara:strand:- start:3832 stop:4008 length:177 start_codon:yes stop_codon:yes gene_type:complete
MILLAMRYADMSFSSVLCKVSALCACHVVPAAANEAQLQTELIEDLFLRKVIWKTKLT